MHMQLPIKSDHSMWSICREMPEMHRTRLSCQQFDKQTRLSNSEFPLGDELASTFVCERPVTLAHKQQIVRFDVCETRTYALGARPCTWDVRNIWIAPKKPLKLYGDAVTDDCSDLFARLLAFYNTKYFISWCCLQTKKEKRMSRPKKHIRLVSHRVDGTGVYMCWMAS